MYLEHYQIKLKPFEIDPDPKFLWLGEKHKEAFAKLKYVIKENKGAVCLVGEPGTGKSTLLNAVAHSFRNQILSAKILDPSLSERDFFNLIADGFEIDKSFNRAEDFFAYLRHFALDAFANAKRVVLIIDEAHRVHAKLLERIQSISNIRKEGRSLITIVFAGQNEFGEVLRANRALSQTMAMSYTLQPLTEAETAEYIMHRLRVAGSATEIFTSSANAEIFRFSGGIPRLINIIADNALLSGYASNIKKIGPEIILDSQGPGHRLIHEICELDKEFTAQQPVHPQEHREGAVLAIEAQTTKKKRPSGTITRLLQNLLETLGLKPLTIKGALAAPISLIVLLGLSGFFYFPNADDDQPLTKLQAHSEQIPSRRTILQTDASRSAPSGLKGAAAVANIKKHGGGDDRQPGIAVAADEDRTRAPEITRLQDQLRFLLQQLQTAFDATAQLEQSLKAIEKDLSLEKGSKGKLSAEASAKEAELQELRKTLEASKSQQLALTEEVKKVKSDNAQLQGQLGDLKTQKAAAESLLSQQQSKSNAVAADLNELKQAKKRLEELEAEAAAKDQKLAQLEQSLKAIEKDLSLEKGSKGKLSAEASAKEAELQELRKTLETSKSQQLALAEEVKKVKNDNAQLQAQLGDLKTQKAAAESLLGQQQTKYNAVAADLNELKQAKKRLGELEGEAAAKDQKLAQLEQSLKALEKDLSLEKGSKGKLSAEASAKEAELQELRKTLETSKSQQLALAEEVKKVKNDNAQLQAQLGDLKTQKAVPISSDVSKMPAAPKPHVDRSEKGGPAQAAPTDIIDFVIKKKTQ